MAKKKNIKAQAGKTITNPVDYVNDYMASPQFKKRYKAIDETYEQSQKHLKEVASKHKPFILEDAKNSPGSRTTNYPDINKQLGLPINTTILLDKNQAKRYNTDLNNEVLPHEYAHNARNLDFLDELYINASNKNPKAMKIFSNWQKDEKAQKYKMGYSAWLKNISSGNHDDAPDEIYADLTSLRWLMYKNGIYDTRKGDMKEADFNKAMKNKEISNSFTLKRLLKKLQAKDLIKLNNTIAKNNNSENFDGANKLSEAQAGDTLFVSNPNDPRLKAYNDSLSLYNQTMKSLQPLLAKNFKIDNNKWDNQSGNIKDPITGKKIPISELQDNGRYKILDKNQIGSINPNIKPSNFLQLKRKAEDRPVFGDKYGSMFASGADYWYTPEYDKPKQEVIYRPITNKSIIVQKPQPKKIDKKPVQPVVYEPVQAFNKKIIPADLTNLGQIPIPNYHAQNIQQTPSDFSFTIRDEKEAGKQRTINFPNLATWQSFRDNNVTPISSEISGDNKKAQGAGYLKEYFTGGTLPGAGAMMYARTGQDWKPKNISQAGKMIAAQAGLTAYDYSNPRKFQNVVSESTATKQRPSTLGYNKQEQAAEQDMLAQKIVNENARKQARIQERQAASRTRQDENTPFTFENGQKKLWQDMNWREKFYVAGKNLGNQSRIFKDEESIIDDIQPLGMLGNMMEAVGTAPKQAQESDSVMPYVGAAAGPLATGAMGTIGAKNMGQWASNVMGTDVFKDLKKGALGIKDAIDDEIIIPIQYRKQIQELKNLNNQIPEVFSRPDVVEKLNLLAIDKNTAQEIPNLTFNRSRDYGSYYSPKENRINIDFRHMGELNKEGFDFTPGTIYQHELGHKLQRDFDKSNLSSPRTMFFTRPTGIDRTTKDWLPKKTVNERGMENAHYFFENPVERLAHLREMRQNMINSKVIKDQFEPITEQHLETFGNLNTADRVSSFMDLNNPNVRRKMKDIFRMLPAAAPAVAASNEYKAGGDIPVSSNGLYEYPNQDVIVPTSDGSITMEGIDTNVMATDLETGQQVEMEPGQNYQFEGNMVLEQPLGGGDKPSKAAQMQRDSKAVLSAKSMFDKNKTYQQILKEVSEEMKVDPRFLFGSAYQEGLDRVAVNPDSVSKGYERSYLKDKKMQAYPVDGFMLGLDNFGSRYKEFVKKGYLPEDFDFYPFKVTNEKGPVTTAAFRNTKDALKAKAAFMKAEADSVKEYAGKLKIELSPEDEAYFAMASYNGGFGNAKKMMDNLKKSGLKAKDWIEKGNTGYKPIHDHVYPRLNRALLATEFFEAGGSIQNKGQLKKLDQLTNFTNYNYE